MSKKVRCKFLCNKSDSSENSYQPGQSHSSYGYGFSPIYSDDEESENKTFWDATPSGELKFDCVSKQDFKVGEFYYIDITLAE